MLIHMPSVEFPRLQYLSPQGELAPDTPADLRRADFLIPAYRHLWRTRLFDQKAIALQRTGQLGTYASCLGQEAVSTGIGLSLHSDDVLVPYYRDQAAQLLRGVSMVEILQFWGGDEAGCNFAGPRQDLPNCIPIATQIAHAAGVASAIKIRGEARAVLATCGDGATSRGDFYEPLNLAGVWHLPLVVVVNNNQWAISVPLSAQTAAPTLAHKALAAGVPAIRVDGNDILAVTAAVREALTRARAGKGPALIEAVTWRLCDHTTADDMSRYCPEAKRDAARTEEPLLRLRRLLEHDYAWSGEHQQALEAELAAEIDAQVRDYLALSPPPLSAMFDWLYAELPAGLVQQRARWLARHHGGTPS